MCAYNCAIVTIASSCLISPGVIGSIVNKVGSTPDTKSEGWKSQVATHQGVLSYGILGLVVLVGLLPSQYDYTVHTVTPARNLPQITEIDKIR